MLNFVFKCVYFPPKVWLQPMQQNANGISAQSLHMNDLQIPFEKAVHIFIRRPLRFLKTFRLEIILNDFIKNNLWLSKINKQMLFDFKLNAISSSVNTLYNLHLLSCLLWKVVVFTTNHIFSWQIVFPFQK